MRNLKRALSLTLASVMLLGMMVIGTSAASYPDVTEEHNVEAIEVLQAVGVMSGSDTGNFNPDSLVSRIEMAIVMSNLMNLKVDYFEGQCKFTDVPEWAGKYVAACEANGIVSGVGGGRYGTGNVTATQAALMMLKALGYFQYASDFEGGWDRNTARLASDLRLFTGMDVQNNTELTRNQVAQLALNTLKTPVVVPEDNTLHITGGNGDTAINVTGGSVNYVVTASSQPYAYAIIDDLFADNDTLNGVAGCIVELGEKLYNGKLQLNDSTTVYDDFGRPARKWQYDGTTFGTYPKKEQLRQEYTKKVSGKDLYDLLGSDIVRSIENDSQWIMNVTIDGETSKSVLDGVQDGTYFSIASVKRTNTDAVGKTGNGVLTQVYVDSVHHVVDIAIINTYLAIAEQDYNSRDDDVDLKVYKINEYGSTDKFVKKAGEDEIIAAKGNKLAIEDVKEDDKFLVTIAQGEIQSMVAPEVVSETTLNSFKKESWVKNDDAQYDYASTAMYDVDVLDEYDAVNMKDVTYNVILDKYGYLIGLELNEGVSQYAFLTGIDLGESNLSVKNATANVIFLDGTMKTITVNVEKSEFATFPKVNDTEKAYTTTGGGNDLASMSETNGDLYVTQNDHVDDPGGANTPAPTTRYAQLNTWCTYTEDGNGVYTLKQVGSKSNARKDTTDPVKNAKKVAQSYVDVDDLTTTYVKTAGELPINNKNTSLMGSAHDVAIKPQALNAAGTKTPVAGDFNYVYGNNDTVYINVKLKAVTPKGGVGKLAIVDKVDSAVTGISNVDLTVKDIDKTGDLLGSDVPQAEVYTLYNDNGYAIAVVTLGAVDNGTSSHFAYITKEVSQEDYMGSNTWRWHVDAIVDGQKVQLTEASDGMEYLRKMKPGEWYSVTYDKDGNVNGIKSEGTWTAPSKNLPLDFTVADDKFVEQVSDVRLATNGAAPFGEAFSTVLLKKDYRCQTHSPSYAGAADGDTQIGYMKVEGDTLWTSTGNSEGIRISPNTKTVLILSKTHADDLYETITDGFTGAEGLDKALKTLKTDTVGGYTKFDGILTAVFKDGVATSIILNDMSGNGRDAINETGKPMSVTLNFVHNSTRDTIDSVSYTIYANASYVPNTILAARGLDSAYEALNNAAINITYVEGGDPVTRTVLIKDKVGGGDTPGAGDVTKYIRVEYYTSVSGTAPSLTWTGLVGTEDVLVNGGKTGFGSLVATDCTAPAGYSIKANAANENAFPYDVDCTSSSRMAVKVLVTKLPATQISAIAPENANTFAWVKWGTALDETNIGHVNLKVTYPNGDLVVDVDNDNTFSYAAGTATAWKVDGAAVVTANTNKTCNLPVKIYAEVDTTVVAASGGDLDDWTVAAAGSQTTKTGKATITLTQADKNLAPLTEAEAKALVARLKGDGANTGITVTAFEYKSFTAGTAESAPSADDGTAGSITVEVTFTGVPTAATAGLKIDINAAGTP